MKPDVNCTFGWHFWREKKRLHEVNFGLKKESLKGVLHVQTSLYLREEGDPEPCRLSHPCVALVHVVAHRQDQLHIKHISSSISSSLYISYNK